MNYANSFFHRLVGHFTIYAVSGALLLSAGCGREQRKTPRPSVTKQISDSEPDVASKLVHGVSATPGAVRVAAEVVALPVVTPVPAPNTAKAEIVANPQINTLAILQADPQTDPVIMTCSFKLDPFRFYYVYRAPNNQLHLAQGKSGEKTFKPLGFLVAGQQVTHFTRDASLSSDSREVAVHKVESEGKETVLLLVADQLRHTLEVVRYTSDDPSSKERAIAQSELIKSTKLLVRSTSCVEGLAERDEIIIAREKIFEAGDRAREEAKRVAAIAKDNWDRSGKKIEKGADSLFKSLAEVADKAKDQLQQAGEALKANAGEIGEEAKDVAKGADRGVQRLHEALNAEILEIEERFKAHEFDWGSVAEPSEEALSNLRELLQKK